MAHQCLDWRCARPYKYVERTEDLEHLERQMDITRYQIAAAATDQVPEHTGLGHENTDISRLIPLLGLAGEAGELLTEYKKLLRDGDAHSLFAQRIAEELGDILWYVANIATKFGLDLEKIALQNLEKVRDRWGDTESKIRPEFDAAYPESERLPRRFEVVFSDAPANGIFKVQLTSNGERLGSILTDNAYDPNDGYRFHDVFHCAFAGVLGWSPVMRKLLGMKRKSNPTIDEVEDGARAAAIEEGLCVMIFEYGRQHNFLKGVEALDYQILRSVKDVTSQLEVAGCGLGAWESAI